MKTCPNCNTTKFSYPSQYISDRTIDSEGNIELKVVISCRNPNDPMCFWGYIATFREVRKNKKK